MRLLSSFLEWLEEQEASDLHPPPLLAVAQTGGPLVRACPRQAQELRYSNVMRFSQLRGGRMRSIDSRVDVQLIALGMEEETGSDWSGEKGTVRARRGQCGGWGRGGRWSAL